MGTHEQNKAKKTQIDEFRRLLDELFILNIGCQVQCARCHSGFTVPYMGNAIDFMCRDCGFGEET
jgi:hypothetical protein